MFSANSEYKGACPYATGSQALVELAIEMDVLFHSFVNSSSIIKSSSCPPGPETPPAPHPAVGLFH